MSRNNSKPVIIRRFTMLPNAVNLIQKMLSGDVGKVMPESVWVALTVNTQTVVGQNPDKGKLLEELANNKYVVKKVINEWN